MTQGSLGLAKGEKGIKQQKDSRISGKSSGNIVDSKGVCNSILGQSRTRCNVVTLYYGHVGITQPCLDPIERLNLLRIRSILFNCYNEE